MNYGEKITSLRKNSNMTQAELGDVLNISYQAVSKWERNISQPDFETMTKIAKIFNVDLNYFTESEYKVEKDNVNEQIIHRVNICEHCGKVIENHNIYSKEPYILCNDCHIKEENEKREIELIKQDGFENIKNQADYSLRNNLIFSGIFGILLLILFLVSMDNSTSSISKTEYIFTSIFVSYVLFSFVFQLRTDNFVKDLVVDSIGHTINMPGIIFSLDIDSILFALAYRLIIAPVIIIGIALIIFLGGCFIAILISPFSLPFELISQIRKNREEN